MRFVDLKTIMISLSLSSFLAGNAQKLHLLLLMLMLTLISVRSTPVNIDPCSDCRTKELWDSCNSPLISTEQQCTYDKFLIDVCRSEFPKADVMFCEFSVCLFAQTNNR